MRRVLTMLVVAAALVAPMAATAAAQDEATGSGGTTLSIEPSPKPPEQEVGAAQDRARGGLEGRTMVSFNVNKQDTKIDRLRVRGTGCTIGRGAYITIRDSDGTIARVVDNRGSQIYRYSSYVAVRGTGNNGAIRFFIVQRGDGSLNKYSRVRNSPNISC